MLHIVFRFIIFLSPKFRSNLNIQSNISWRRLEWCIIFIGKLRLKKKLFERVLFGMILIMSRQILYWMVKFVWKCFVGCFIDTMPAWITSISSIHTLQFTYLLFIFVYQQYEIWLKHSSRLSKWYRRKAVDIKN